jgi:hypothetical protein
MRRQKAVWWNRLAPDSYGKHAYDVPVEIECRWEDVGTESRSTTLPAERATASCTVYVDRVMKPGDKLKRGALDSTTAIDPELDTLALVIVTFEQLPDFKARETLYTAKL